MTEPASRDLLRTIRAPHDALPGADHEKVAALRELAIIPGALLAYCEDVLAAQSNMRRELSEIRHIARSHLEQLGIDERSWADFTAANPGVDPWSDRHLRQAG